MSPFLTTQEDFSNDSKDLCDCILGVLSATLTLIALRQGCTTSRDVRTAKNSVGERWSAGLFVSIPPIFSPPTPPIFQEIP